nr:hypothetical protein [Eubacterium sp.]
MEKKEVTIDYIYRETLEENIVEYLVEIQKISSRRAMDIYYRSMLASKVANGMYDTGDVDCKSLVMELIENEKDLF